MADFLDPRTHDKGILQQHYFTSALGDVQCHFLIIEASNCNGRNSYRQVKLDAISASLYTFNRWRPVSYFRSIQAQCFTKRMRNLETSLRMYKIIGDMIIAMWKQNMVMQQGM